jgi:4-hydroxy-3-polyprenylbenzoate decarboxylase
MQNKFSTKKHRLSRQSPYAYNNLVKNIILAITGASGAPFGVRLLEELLKTAAVHLIISSNTFPIIADETGHDWTGDTESKLRREFGAETLYYYEDKNMIERAADVTLKEGRHLLLSPREMPFSAIHLENMLKLARLGVTIAPPVAAFYHHPKNLEAMIDFITGKILDSFGIGHALFKQWGS